MPPFPSVLMSAAKHGELDRLRRLIEVGNEPVTPAVFAKAAEAGQVECVRYLLPLACPKGIEEGLIFAAIEGRDAIVQLLLARTTDINTFNTSVFHACINNHERVFSMLYPLCDAENIQQRLQLAQYGVDHPKARLFYERTAQEALRNTLIAEVEGAHTVRKSKM